MPNDQNSLNPGIISILGKPLNIYEKNYLSQDEGSDSLFEDLDDLGCLEIAGIEYGFPKVFISGASSIKYLNGDSSPKENDEISSGSSFYSYGKKLESSLSSEGDFLMFSSQISGFFNLDKTEMSTHSFALRKKFVSIYRAKLDLIEYAKDRFRTSSDSDDSEKPSIWETLDLFDEIDKHEDNPTKFFEDFGTHLICGFEIGAIFNAVVTTESTSEKSMNELEASLKLENDGVFGIGSSSFSASAYVSSVENSVSTKSEAKTFSHGRLKDDNTVEEPAIISYNGEFLPIHELIKPFNSDIAKKYKSAFDSYRSQFKVDDNLHDDKPVAWINNDSIELYVGVNQVDGKHKLKGLKIDKGFLVTIKDTDGGKIMIQGDEHDLNLDDINTDTVFKDGGKIDKLGELSEIRVEPIAVGKNELTTIFQSENYDYSKPWCSLSVGDKISQLPKSLEDCMGSILVPNDCEVRIYQDKDYEGRMWSNIKKPQENDQDTDRLAIQRIWGHHDVSSIKTITRKEPLVALFIRYGCNYSEEFISVPLHNYKHLSDQDYKGNPYFGWKLREFFDDGEYQNLKTKNWSEKISSFIIPKGVTAKFRTYNKYNAKDPDAYVGYRKISLDTKDKEYNDVLTAMHLYNT